MRTPIAPAFYGWQVEAWRAGQLHLKAEPHPMLRTLADPYDGQQNAAYRILDLTYFNERYYLYFGTGPALLLYGPWTWAMGDYLTDSAGVLVFSTLSCFLSLCWLNWVRHRFFPALDWSWWLLGGLIACVGGLQLVHAQSASVYQVAQTCAYACLWAALICASVVITATSLRRKLIALTGTSIGLGFAFLSRPSFLPAALLLIPLIVQLLRSNATPGALCSESTSSEGAKRGWRRFLSWRTAKIAAAAAGPLIFACAFAAWHNWARFAAPFEFGNRYQLADIDQRGVQLMSWWFIPRNVTSMLFAMPSFGSYFPFVDAQLEPVGLLFLLPFAWCIFGMGFYADRTFRQLVSGVALALVGIALPVTAYYLNWARYQIDFTMLWMPCAVVGAWALSRSLRGWAKRLFTASALGLGVYSAAVALGYTLRHSPEPLRWAWLATGANAIAEAVRPSAGESYGALDLTVTWSGTSEWNVPLVLTGRKGHDLVYARRLADDRVVLGYFHAGVGGPESEPFEWPRDQPTRVVVAHGGLLPPVDHPFFAALSKLEVRHLRRRLVVSVDDAPRLRGHVDAYESSARDLLLGLNPTLPTVSGPRFPGSIQLHGRRSLHDLPYPEWPRSGPVQLDVQFVAGRTSVTEPLLATADRVGASLLFVSYEPSGKMRLGVDRLGAGAQYSAPVTIEPGRLYRVDVQPAPDDPGTGLIYFGGERVLRAARFFEEESAYVFGLNVVRSGASSSMFSGAIRAVVPSQLNPAPSVRLGPIELTIIFDPAGFGRPQPLVATGTTGAGDLVYVIPRGDTLQFGFDHWGVGGPQSEPVPVDLALPQRIRVELPSLDAQSAPGLIEGALSIWVDDRVAWHTKVQVYPSSADDVAIARNSLGASTAGPLLLGSVEEGRK